MANRFFSWSLGNTNDSGVTEAGSTTAADFVEVRIDEGQSTSLNDIIVALTKIKKRLQEDQRYA